MTSDPKDALPTAEPRTASRRRFLRLMAMLAVGGRTLFRTGNARAMVDAALALAEAEEQLPAMPRRALGRTGWNASRLVFGCGAALSSGRRDDLLEAALATGINVFDVGFRGYYRDAEKNLAPFLRQHRDEVFLISKAIASVDITPSQPLSAEQRGQAASAWARSLDNSLRELGVDHVDAYYLMAANNVDLITSDEIRSTFERAKQAGKVKHLGLSTHQNAEKVLAAAAGTGAYSLAMIAITPAGWYDWSNKGILAGSKPMTDLQPALAQARKAGIALVGMKAGRYLAGRWYSRGKADVFDRHYDAEFLKSGLSAFQRSYAYVLAHGLDVVNADMQSLAHLRENIVATAGSARYFA